MEKKDRDGASSNWEAFCSLANADIERFANELKAPRAGAWFLKRKRRTRDFPVPGGVLNPNC